MKKRLLFTFVAALGVATSLFAYNNGDYVYTRDARYRIVGENLLKNGDFSQGLAEWKTIDGNALDAAKITVTTDDGLDGKPCIYIASGEHGYTSTITNSTNFTQTALVDGGNQYIFTYKTKSFAGGNTSTMMYSRCANYQNCIMNTDGQIPQKAGDDTEVGKIQADLCDWSVCAAGEWEEKAYYYKAEEDCCLSVFFFNLIVGDRFADFGIYKVTQVYDDRDVKEAIDYLNFFVNDKENFPGAEDCLGEAIAELQGYVDEVKDATPDDVKGIIADVFDMDLAIYLDEISADLSLYYTDFDFNSSTTGNPAKVVPTGWTSSIGLNRWGCRDGEADPWVNFTSKYAISEIPANYELAGCSLTQGSNLPKGKYLYVVQAQANKYMQNGSGGSSNYYIADWATQVEGLQFFVNSETADMTDLPTTRGRIYPHIFNVAEDGVQTIGFSYPTIAKCDGGTPPNCVSGGGAVRFDNIAIRLLGVSADDVRAYYLANTLADAQNALRVMIDSASTVVEKTEYVFGKQVLRDSIAASNNVMATLTDATEENIAALGVQMNYMRDAIRAYYTLNVEYVQLATDIADCKTLLADESRTKGRDEFQAAITTAENYYNAITVTTERDSLGIMQTDEALLEAKGTYMLVNASPTTPGEVQMVNNSFQKKSMEGWEHDNGASSPGKSNWKFDTSDDFSERYYACFNRGYLATDYKWAWQDVKIPANGVYIFTAECICNNSSWSTTLSYEDAVTNTWLFAGTDSVKVYTPGLGNKSQDFPGNVRKFWVKAEVEDMNALENPGYLRVGIEKPAPAEGEAAVALGLIYISSCHLNYYGSIEEYNTGISNVNAKEIENGDVYSINGVKVRANANSLQGLPKGLYIMNGKKYVVK